MNDPQMAEIQRTLGQLLANQDSFLRLMEERREEHKDLVKRVSSIEDKINVAVGVWLAASVGLTIVINYVLDKLGFK